MAGYPQGGLRKQLEFLACPSYYIESTKQQRQGRLEGVKSSPAAKDKESLHGSACSSVWH